MRIISGKFGGRAIGAVPAAGVRPAMGKTREALFSMLDARGMAWEGALALDLFAGSGSLAFEALSRGAAAACLVENGQDAFACIGRNAASLGVEDLCSLVKMDVCRFLRGKPASGFDLVFIDPPYGRNLAGRALAALVENGWLNMGAFVAAEIEKDAAVEPGPSLLPQARKLFGQTCLLLWKKQ